MTRTPKTALLGAALSLAVLASPAAAQQLGHNGSTMRLEARGDDVKIFYVAPRPGLQKAGVAPGALLFEGKKTVDGTIVGLARVWKPGCPEPAKYSVTGKVDGDQLVLSGPGPRFEGCTVAQLVENGHSHLVFTGSKETLARLQGDPAGAPLPPAIETHATAPVQSPPPAAPAAVSAPVAREVPVATTPPQVAEPEYDGDALDGTTATVVPPPAPAPSAKSEPPKPAVRVVPMTQTPGPQPLVDPRPKQGSGVVDSLSIQ